MGDLRHQGQGMRRRAGYPSATINATQSSDATSVQNFDTGEGIHMSDAAAHMYGIGSKQHCAAIKRFGKGTL